MRKPAAEQEVVEPAPELSGVSDLRAPTPPVAADTADAIDAAKGAEDEPAELDVVSVDEPSELEEEEDVLDAAMSFDHVDSNDAGDIMPADAAAAGGEAPDATFSPAACHSPISMRTANSFVFSPAASFRRASSSANFGPTRSLGNVEIDFVDDASEVDNNKVDRHSPV